MHGGRESGREKCDCVEMFASVTADARQLAKGLQERTENQANMCRECGRAHRNDDGK